MKRQYICNKRVEFESIEICSILPRFVLVIRHTSSLYSMSNTKEFLPFVVLSHFSDSLLMIKNFAGIPNSWYVLKEYLSPNRLPSFQRLKLSHNGKSCNYQKYHHLYGKRPYIKIKIPIWRPYWKISYQSCYDVAISSKFWFEREWLQILLRTVCEWPISNGKTMCKSLNPDMNT